jgi:hypothetical protein
MTIINPMLAVSTLTDNGRLTRVNVAAPRTNRFLKLETFSCEGGCDSFLAVKSILENRFDFSKCAEGLFAELEGKHILIPEGEDFTLPSFRTEYLPSKRKILSPNPGLRYNPNFQIFRESALPSDLTQLFVEEKWRSLFGPIKEDDFLLWVKHTMTGVWWPYHIDEETAELIACINSDACGVENLSPKSAGVLLDLGILDDQENISALFVADLKEYGIGLLEGLVPASQLSSISRYFASIQQSGIMRLGDRDSVYRGWTHNESVARFFGVQFAQFVSRLLSERMTPMFSSFVSYLEGSALPEHQDREPDTISISLQLSYFKNGQITSNDWPFTIKAWKDKGYVSFLPQAGDGVLFWGQSQKHSRPDIPPKSRSDVLIMHFVRDRYWRKVRH